MTHESCLIPDPPAHPALATCHEDGVGIDDGYTGGVSREIKIQQITAIHHREEPRLARIRYRSILASPVRTFRAYAL